MSDAEMLLAMRVFLLEQERVNAALLRGETKGPITMRERLEMLQFKILKLRMKLEP